MKLVIIFEDCSETSVHANGFLRKKLSNGKSGGVIDGRYVRRSLFMSNFIC